MRRFTKKVAAAGLLLALLLALFPLTADAVVVTYKSNVFNVLHIVFKSAVLNHEFNERIISGTETYSQQDLQKKLDVADVFKPLMQYTTDGLCVTSVFDTVLIDEPLAAERIVGRQGAGYHIDAYDIADILDVYLARGDYQQIFVSAPIGRIADGWGGLGGMWYKGVAYAEMQTAPQAASYLHETIHCLDAKAWNEGYNPIGLHEAYDKYDYGQSVYYHLEEFEVETQQRDYMINALSYQPNGASGDGDGLPREVYSFAHKLAIYPTEAAYKLNSLGLFNGVGENANGTPNFALDRAPTRAEAVTMLVRLLGKETEALAGAWTTPFTDVAEWAEPYIGYAYTHGLTNGTGDTTFSGESSVTAAQYITLVLRALGYSSDRDFAWDKSWELSDVIGLTDGSYNAGTTTFLRGDVAVISFGALLMEYKSGGILHEAIIDASGWNDVFLIQAKG
ncbi:MAG: S-layer homology domain-containing protein [Oscillospiraceae bacterium]|jgi:hypothetical protein|nr:S-layer homology domain-containing protein [Oscillospiraceae bacterium]